MTRPPELDSAAGPGLLPDVTNRIPAGRVALAAALTLIGLLTLRPGGPGEAGAAGPDPADLLANLGLYLPLGLAARRQGIGLPRAVSLGAGVSLLVELAQWLVIPGRHASPWDLLANTAGAWAGAALPLPALAAAPVLAWLAGPLLLAPAPPASPRWWGQWEHHFGGTIPFAGRIDAVALNGIETPDHELSSPTTDSLRLTFRRPPLTLLVAFDPAPAPPSGLAHLASVADGRGRTVAGAWQRQDAVEVTWHSRGTALGLRPPSARADGLLAALGEGPVTLRVSIGRGAIGFSAGDGARDAGASLRLGPWEGWRLLWPFAPPPTTPARIVSLLWTLACVGPAAGVAWVLRRRRN